MFQGMKRRWINSKLYAMENDRLKYVESTMILVKDMVAFPVVRAILPEAIERTDYLLSHSSIVSPMLIGNNDVELIRLSVPANNDLVQLSIFPFFSKDALLSSDMEYCRERIGFAVYAPQNHMIILNTETFETPRFMASTMLHEAGHAIVAEKEGRNNNFAKRTEKERLQEELRMWHFDCKLAFLLGGAYYQKEIGKAVTSVLSARRAGILFHVQTLGPRIGWPLDLCYGSTLSPYAIKNREFLWAIFCELIASDMGLGSDAHSYQIKLVEATYKDWWEKDMDYALSRKK